MLAPRAYGPVALTITSSSTPTTAGDTTFSNVSNERALSHTKPTNSPSPSGDKRTRLPPLDTDTPSEPLTDTDPAVDASRTLDDDTRTADAVSSAPSPNTPDTPSPPLTDTSPPDTTANTPTTASNVPTNLISKGFWIFGMFG